MEGNELVTGSEGIGRGEKGVKGNEEIESVDRFRRRKTTRMKRKRRGRRRIQNRRGGSSGEQQKNKDRETRIRRG
jgi:hypothetical protein